MTNKIDYLENLNDKQREAVLHTEGALLILAGAGSGKTSTMTKKIAYLIKEKEINPYNILAVTFTNKAATEMRERVEALMGGKIDIWLLTFHAMCLRILRVEAEHIGFAKDFTIYDPTDQKSIIKDILKENSIDEKNFAPAMVLGKISNAKESYISPEEYQNTAENFIEEKVASIYKMYDSRLRKNNAMDFDDLILNTVRLFKKHPDILRKYQNRFKYLMVDEYQDTNKLQYEIVKMLSEVSGNISVVGDDDQCIYQWRGADITNILNFERDFPNAKVVKLEQNYRSTGNILAAAHSVISNNSQRKAKKLWTSAEAGEKIRYERFSDDRMEADFVSMEIDNLVSKGASYGDCAILYRTNVQSRTFEDALTRRSIAYRVVGGFRYYDRLEIKDMLSYMRLVSNLKDDIAFERIINTPKRSIGKSSVEKLKAVARFKDISLFEAIMRDDVIDIFSSKARGSVIAFKNMILKYHEEKENLKIQDIYLGLLHDSGYLADLEKQNTDEAVSRIENILDFQSAIIDLGKDEEKDFELEEFLEKLALLSDIDNHDESEDAVSLMTMHSAKGLEFPFVFMPGMEDGIFPSWRSKNEAAKLEEERRLCYVGITRAMKKLWLTSAERRMMYGKTIYSAESEFMREIDKKLIHGAMPWDRPVEATLGFERNLDGVSLFKEESPFKSVSNAMQSSKKKIEKIEVVVGDKVKHSKFGAGEVLEVDEKIVKILFDSGEVKKLARAVAPLDKI